MKTNHGVDSHYYKKQKYLCSHLDISKLAMLSCLVRRFTIYSLCYLLPLLALFQRHCPHRISFFDEFINCPVQCWILHILHQHIHTHSTSTLEVKLHAPGYSMAGLLHAFSFLHALRSHPWVQTLEPKLMGIQYHYLLVV